MMPFRTVFEIEEAINCPLYEKGDRMSLTDKTFSCPDGKEVCLILVRDMTQLLFVMLGEHDKDGKAVSGKQYNCSGCTGLIKLSRNEQADNEEGDAEGVVARIQDVMHKMHGSEIECPFLQAIPKGKVSSILNRFQQMNVPADTILVRQGEPNHNLYLILAGSFCIESSGVNIAVLREGEIFGEMSYLGAERAIATVRAKEDSLVMAIAAQDFAALMNSDPSVQFFMARLLAGRLQQVNAARARDFESSMAGRLNDVVPAELFQVFHLHQKTGVLEMNLAHGEARVLFREGCLINARYGEKQNQDAIFAMLSEKNGFYRFTSGLTAQEMETEEIGDFMTLLMEGVKKVDEVSGM